MARKPDWQALGALFDQAPLAPTTEPPSAHDDGTAVYNGERWPKWLVSDLMQERAAIMEFDGGLTREEAEALTLQGLQRGHV